MILEKISVKDLKVKAKVGVIPEERILGNYLVFQIELLMNKSIDETIRLKDTLDYSHVVAVVQKHAEQEYELLEQIGHAIFTELKKIKMVYGGKMEICKLNPPIDVLEAKVCVQIKF